MANEFGWYFQLYRVSDDLLRLRVCLIQRMCHPPYTIHMYIHEQKVQVFERTSFRYLTMSIIIFDFKFIYSTMRSMISIQMDTSKWQRFCSMIFASPRNKLAYRLEEKAKGHVCDHATSVRETQVALEVLGVR